MQVPGRDDETLLDEVEAGAPSSAEPGSNWETLQRVSEGIGSAAGPVRKEGGGLRQASARWQRWLHEEIDAAARAGLPPPMTMSGAAARPHGATGAGWILPPSLLPESQQQQQPVFSAAAPAGRAAPPPPPPPQWGHTSVGLDGRAAERSPSPSLSGEVVVVRGSGSPLGRQAALSSAEHGATLLLVDPAPPPPPPSTSAPPGQDGAPPWQRQPEGDGGEEVRRIWAEQAQLRKAQAARAAGQELVREVRARYGHTGAGAVYVQVAQEQQGPQGGGALPADVDEKGAAWNCSVERLQL